jgi:hypothetical protein
MPPERRRPAPLRLAERASWNFRDQASSTVTLQRRQLRAQSAPARLQYRTRRGPGTVEIADARMLVASGLDRQELREVRHT